MQTPATPAQGYNNNVRHRGRVFHIQTEDSGHRHPHVITHLFADGGRILKTMKTSYREQLGHEKLSALVGEIMKSQHKAMFVALRDGNFDHMLSDSVPPPALHPPSTMPPPASLIAEPLPSEPSPTCTIPPATGISLPPPEELRLGRYAPSRPASIFALQGPGATDASGKGHTAKAALSLDDAILSYLAQGEPASRRLK